MIESYYNNIINNTFLFIITTFVISLIIDVVFGEIPGKFHPVVIIGSIINFFKNIFIKIKNKSSGFMLVISTFIVVYVILRLICIILSLNDILLIIIFSILLSTTYSVKMLLSTAADVKNDLNESIEKARKSVSYLVSRDTEELSEGFIVSAVIESLSENITDSYVAPIFYYFIIGLIILYNPFNNKIFILLLIPMAYRMFNTLDAMVGYKNDELIHIGYIPAKIDDILNFIPSRIAGLFVVISAYLLKLDGKNSFKVMMMDANNCPSPNSGYTMASTAGALNIQLIKKDTYILGDNNKNINKDDISNAVNLAGLSIFLFTITMILVFVLIYVIL